MGRSGRLNFFHYSNKKHSVKCGCFRGTLKELKAKVKEVHKEGSKHYNEYMEQIKIMEYLLKKVEE